MLANVVQEVGLMVQKDRTLFKTAFKKYIFSLLIIFIMPIPVKSGNQIPVRKDCSLVKKKQVYKYYERQEAHDFGRKIQTLIAKKDIGGIYRNVLIDELQNGPRREYIKNKSFDQIFPKKWVNKVIKSEIDCDSHGWRGFMISNGLIWFDRMESGQWTIKSINGVNQEKFDNKNIIGWETKKGIISPVCFHRWGGGERSYIASFQKFLKLKDQKILNTHPGLFVGREFPLGSQFKGDIHNLSFTSKMENCYSEVVIVDGKVFQKNKPLLFRNGIRNGTNYTILEKLDKPTCQSFAPNLKARCKEGYLLRIGYETGGSIGPFIMYNTYGIFEDSNGTDHVVPLKYSYTKNGALNYLRP